MSGAKIWCLLGVHEYETIQKGPFVRKTDGRVCKRGNYYILRCKVCGNVKRRVLA